MLDRLRQGGYWLVRGKINLIDRAFTSCRIESFADLGAVWGVEGAYTFRALDKYPVKRGSIGRWPHNSNSRGPCKFISATSRY